MQIEISTEYIKLDSAMKLAGAASLGSEAKHLIQNGEVKVNGETETRRGRKLRPGDVFSLGGKSWEVKAGAAEI